MIELLKLIHDLIDKVFDEQGTSWNTRLDRMQNIMAHAGKNSRLAKDCIQLRNDHPSMKVSHDL